MKEEDLIFAPRIGLDSSINARYAILPGDPERVKTIAEFLDNPRPISVNREYTSYEAFIDNEKIIVMSTGMGGPSASIAGLNNPTMRDMTATIETVVEALKELIDTDKKKI